LAALVSTILKGQLKLFQQPAKIFNCQGGGPLSVVKVKIIFVSQVGFQHFMSPGVAIAASAVAAFSVVNFVQIDYQHNIDSGSSL